MSALSIPRCTIAPASPVPLGFAPDSPAERDQRRRAAIRARLAAPEEGMDSADALRAATKAALANFQPSNAWDHWVVEQIATLQVRISQTQGAERRLRDWAAYRAGDFWVEDQTLQVVTLAEQLPRHPARTVARLRQTPAGSDWLIARWEALAQVDVVAWTEDQRTLASHLLGFTSGMAGTLDQTPDPQAEIESLQTHRRRVTEADALTRNLVEARLSDQIGPDLARLQRTERGLLDRLRFFLAQLSDRRFGFMPPQPPPVSPNPPRDETKPSSAPADETKPLASPVDETKPLSSPSASAAEQEIAIEPPQNQPVASRIDPAHATYRQARLDLQKARKRERQARRRRA